ncbi:hypothetical protein BESB_021630 [Besnoitia besnoiti]|uniref:Transmembrane protein n=1 Tax=Besnoitia besnoiti TaxID=94643 RepID=A0A2A9MA13_BESBE|nr:hypothetical protein BESB_021630 [Besnoitia besnoiti]PFH32222.1 hypothetical protein BESB_021630 [Besnoitia besnoiti]
MTVAPVIRRIAFSGKKSRHTPTDRICVFKNQTATMFAFQDSEQQQLQKLIRDKFITRVRAFALYVAALRLLPTVFWIFSSETPKNQISA